MRDVEFEGGVRPPQSTAACLLHVAASRAGVCPFLGIVGAGPKQTTTGDKGGQYVQTATPRGLRAAKRDLKPPPSHSTAFWLPCTRSIYAVNTAPTTCDACILSGPQSVPFWRRIRSNSKCFLSLTVLKNETAVLKGLRALPYY